MVHPIMVLANFGKLLRRAKWLCPIFVIQQRQTHLLWTIATVGLVFLAFLPAPLSAQNQTITPGRTVSENPAEVDKLWQDASTKYDAARATILRKVNAQIKDGPFRPDWDSLANYEIPGWYRDAKFGIFIHWGVYSVPAFGSEWYARRMYIQGSKEYEHQLSTYGPLTRFGYKDFIPMFKAEHFDPQAWAHLFKEAGAKYVVPVFEHHDGFAMYDSELSDWTAVKMGPHQDLAGELAKAVRSEGLHFGASSHRIEHDWFMDVGHAIDSDVDDSRYAAFYGPAHPHLWQHGRPLLEDWTYLSSQFADDWLARDAEIVEKYHPELMYFDYWIGQPEVRPYLARFAAYYYNESLKRRSVGIINYKGNAMRDQSAVLDLERGQLAEIRSPAWQTDTSVSNKSWGYINDDTFKTPDFIVHELIDVVSKNGNLLLNIGPRADGTIPAEVQQILLDVGSWLKINGEAIYGTRPCRAYGEGPTRIVEGALHDTDRQSFTAEDFRFTCKENILYAIEMGWPSTGEAVVHSLGAVIQDEQKIESITLLGSEVRISFRQSSGSLIIQVPDQAAGKYAYVFRIVLRAGTSPQKPAE
jgi:alpha-L-fucosidase